MTTLTCDQVSDLADELALDALPGDVRALALEHLDDCPACRANVDSLSETADHLLLANGPVEPPHGFADRVMARLELERRPPARRPRRTLALVAAAAAVIVLTGGVTALAVRSGDGGERGPVATAAPPTALDTVALVTPAGRAVGDVSAYAADKSWFFMRVADGVPSATYTCVLDVAGGRTIAIGTLTVTNGKGGWGESLSIGALAVKAARLVAPDGTTVATARFH